MSTASLAPLGGPGRRPGALAGPAMLPEARSRGRHTHVDPQGANNQIVHIDG